VNWINRLWNHRPENQSQKKARQRVELQGLENRTLLSAPPHITNALADNRGKVELTVDAPLNAAAITDNAIAIFTKDANGQFTVRQPVTVRYRAGTNRLVAKAALPAETPYMVKAKAKFITADDGTPLDGEFNGASAISGNGTAGGAYIFQTSDPGAGHQLAIFYTTAGKMKVRLFDQDTTLTVKDAAGNTIQRLFKATPLTVTNFHLYADRGDWDGTYFHRNVPGFVIQGGGFKAGAAENDFSNPINDDGAFPGVQNEPVNSNDIPGTIAMAKLGGNANSATDQWFFNLANNSSNLDNQNGGFTAFGMMQNASGLTAMSTVSSGGQVDISGLSTNAAIATNFQTVPFVDLAAAQARGFVEPQTDLYVVNRIAFKMNISGMPAAAAPLAASVVSAPTPAATAGSDGTDTSGAAAQADVLGEDGSSGNAV
jgi:cyclophilin family peptidyl-prolyl cis-trans isomerase